MKLFARLLVACTLLMPLTSARATEADPSEKVQSDVSTREISIQSNFTGIEIVLFGSVDFTRAPPAEQTGYDVIMVVRGPAEPVVVWRKEKLAGLWVNSESETFAEVPTFYAVLASRPLRAIAAGPTLAQLGIGFENIDFGRAAEATTAGERFRSALIRLKKQNQLFQESDDGVTFIGRSLFRGSVSLPVNVPIGRYTSQVFLFRDGKLLSQSQSSLRVNKVGFERFAYSLAFKRPFLYGLLAVLMAVSAGLIAWAAFRRA